MSESDRRFEIRSDRVLGPFTERVARGRIAAMRDAWRCTAGPDTVELWERVDTVTLRLVETVLFQLSGDSIATAAVALSRDGALEQELAEVRSAFREVLDLHEQPPREDADGFYPWFSGDIGLDEMAGYRAMLGDIS